MIWAWVSPDWGRKWRLSTPSISPALQQISAASSQMVPAVSVNAA